MSVPNCWGNNSKNLAYIAKYSMSVLFIADYIYTTKLWVYDPVRNHLGTQRPKERVFQSYPHCLHWRSGSLISTQNPQRLIAGTAFWFLTRGVTVNIISSWGKHSTFDSQMSGHCSFVDTFNLVAQAPERIRLSGDHSGSWKKHEVAKGTANKAFFPKPLHGSTRLPPKYSNDLSSSSFGRTNHALDPCGYQCAKARLREAVVEHYRYVESSKGRGWAGLALSWGGGGLCPEHDADIRIYS